MLALLHCGGTLAAPKVYYVHTDHLGTPRALSDKNQTVVWRAHYEPFGAATVDEDPDGDGARVVMPIRFPGQYFDSESGLHYNYFRDYDPGTGRYIQSDPIGLAGGVNTYGYVGGNSLTYTDPTGEIPVVPVIIGLALWGGSQSATLQNLAANAAQYWANQQVQTGNPLYEIPGALATLADPCNANTAASVLGAGAMAGAYLGRPFWQYYPAGNTGYSSPWMTRGWGWKPPYPTGSQAAQKLALPPYNPATAVRPVSPSPLQYIGGPRPVQPQPQWGRPGGGVEYKVGEF